MNHHGLVGLLTQAGVDDESAHRDVDSLHQGKVIVLARVDADQAADAARILSRDPA